MNIYILISFIVFVSYFLILNLFHLGLQTTAFFGSLRRIREAKYTNFKLMSSSYLTPPVSIVVPARNEEIGIVNCVYSALKSDYPEFEVVVVNDGSSDRTLEVLEDEFDLKARDVFYRSTLQTADVIGVYQSDRLPNLWVIEKEHGGKADAVNAGVNLARYPYIVNSDADSIFDPQGLIRIIRLMNLDPEKTAGIGGQVRIGNGLTVNKGTVEKKRLAPGLIPKMQMVEYLGSFLGNRTGWSEINSVLVVAGAFGLWRRKDLIELGGMTTETTHEDIEYTFRLHEHLGKLGRPYHIAFIPDPIVWTEVPITWRGLLTQRRRWQRVVIEVFWIYRRMFLNPRYGAVGVIGMPYVLFFEIFGPILEICGYIAMGVFFAMGLVPGSAVLTFLLVALGLTIITRAAGMFVEQYSFRTYPMSGIIKLLGIAAFENFGYRQAVSVWRVLALYDWAFGKKQWTRISRQGWHAQPE